MLPTVLLFHIINSNIMRIVATHTLVLLALQYFNSYVHYTKLHVSFDVIVQLTRHFLLFPACILQGYCLCNHPL